LKLNAFAQSLVEYMTVIILIIVGMLIGQGVFERGFKGGIKQLTDSVEEAELEIIRQTPPGGVKLPECSCGAWNPTTCGHTPCLPTQMHFERTCTPSGCENSVSPPIPTFYCDFDENCCTDWELLPGGIANCGVNAPFTQTGCTACPCPGCPDDTGYSWRQCGNLSIEFGCADVHPLCYFRCDPLTLFLGETPCFPPPGPGPQPQSAFIGDHARLQNATTGYYLVSSAAACGSNNPSLCDPAVPPTPKCKSYCQPPMTPIGSGLGGSCACATGTTATLLPSPPGGTGCVCNDTTAGIQSCAGFPGYCRQGPGAAGRCTRMP